MADTSRTMAAAICIHDDYELLAPTIRAVASAVPCYLFISTKAWDGSEGQWLGAAVTAQRLGIPAVEGVWTSEFEHRSFAARYLQDLGFNYMLIVDSDEILERQLLLTLQDIAAKNSYDVVKVTLETYWKSPAFRIEPREAFRPTSLVSLADTTYHGLREYDGKRCLVLPESAGLLHHLSYVGSSSRIARKISTWSHKEEVVRHWFENVWIAWDRDHEMKYLHPTHPYCFNRAIPHSPTPLAFAVL